MQPLRHIALLVTCLSLWVTPLAQAGSFIIELTNGREMHTSHVWEEGDELKFYAPQGTAGVPKALVKRIRPDDHARPDQVSRRALALRVPEAPTSTSDASSAMNDLPAAPAGEAPGQGAPPQTTPEQGQAKLSAKDVQAYQEQKAKLRSQVDEANHTYLAASGARDPAAKQAALQEMRASAKQFYALADEVKAKYGGTLPAWWHD
jgi:hypothetical protein